MTCEQQIEVEAADGPEGLALPGQVHREHLRSFRKHFSIIPEDIPGKKRPGHFIEQADAAGRMAWDGNAGEAVDIVPVFQKQIWREESRFHDFSHDSHDKAHNSRVTRQGERPVYVPCIGLADCNLCSRGSIFQCCNSTDMIHMEMSDEDSPDLLWFPVQLIPDIGKDLLSAAGRAGIDDDQAVADKDVTVPVDSINLVYARYYLHSITEDEYGSPGLSGFPVKYLTCYFSDARNTSD